MSGPYDGPPLELRLYVAGKTAISQRAAHNLERINRDHFNGQCQIEIVDIFATPQRALEDGILVTPTLIKLSPAPRVRIIGDLSAEERVIFSLGGR